MFMGIEKNELNERAINFLENFAVDYENFSSRVILFGENPLERTRIVEDVLTVLNSQNYKTRYYHVNDILENKYKYLDKAELTVLDGLLDNKNLTEQQKREIDNFLNVHQHSDILITSPLTAKEVFSDEFRYFFDDKGITWSRNFLGCNQLFLDDSDRNNYMHYLINEPVGDYRVKQSIDFLSQNIVPFDELSFLSYEIINQVLSKGDDAYHNTLAITKKYELKLIPFSQIKSNLDNIAVYLEAFMAGNGYVGSEQSNSELNSYYRLLLKGLYTFIHTNETQYIDYEPHINKSTYEILREIKKYFKTKGIYV